MKILDVNVRTFTYESDILQFFLNENKYGFLDTTGRRTSRKDYIYHVYLLWYDSEYGEAKRVRIGQIRTNIKYTLKNDPEFKKELEQLMVKAEKTRFPFERVLSFTFT